MLVKRMEILFNVKGKAPISIFDSDSFYFSDSLYFVFFISFSLPFFKASYINLDFCIFSELRL